MAIKRRFSIDEIVRKKELKNQKKRPRIEPAVCEVCRTQNSISDHSNPQISPEAPTDHLAKLENYKQRMLANGWCSHQVHHLSRSYNLKTFEYLSSCTRSSIRSIPHTLCANYSSCVAYNIDASTYSTNHIAQGCNCSALEVYYPSLISIIQKGKIPLVTIDVNDSAGDPYKLSVSPMSAKSKYIAISHVWYDGLGNPQANSLPACQIFYLSEKLKILWNTLEKTEKIKGPISFWMDTLCIPVHASDTVLRALQIDKMASIYKGAVCTLVLDRELMSLKMGNGSSERYGNLFSNRIEEDITLSLWNRASIACSVWMSRSWTFQEGMLPRLVAIQFQDASCIIGPRSIKDGECIERSSTDFNPPLRYARNQTCECIRIHLREQFFAKMCTDSVSFIEIWNELLGRSTTKSEDVPFMITNLLDRENLELLACNEPGQMLQALLLSLDSIPLSIFFLTGAKYSQIGNHKNRWVPSDVCAEELEASPSLNVRKGYFEYTGRLSDTRYKVYIIDQVVPIRDGMKIMLEDDDKTYTAKYEPADLNHLDTTPFTSTCLVVDTEASRTSPSQSRIACFYQKSRQGIDWYHSLDSIWRWKTRRIVPHLTMVFNCTFCVQVQTDNTKTPKTTATYKFRAQDAESDIHIEYDIPSSFRKLRRRTRSFDDFTRLNDIRAATGIIGGFGAFALGSFAFVALDRTSLGGASFFIAILIGAAGGIAVGVLIEMLIRIFQRWRDYSYRRSFEAVARRRLKLYEA